MNRISQSPSKLRITGKLALNAESAWSGSRLLLDLHCCLEQLVQIVHPLDEFESNACNEELLELLHYEPTGMESHYKGRD